LLTAIDLTETLIIVVALFVVAGLRQFYASEMKRLTQRVRHLEADHKADMAQIANMQERLMGMISITSKQAELLEGTIKLLRENDIPLPETDEDIIRLLRRSNRRDLWPDRDAEVMCYHTLTKFFDLGEMESLAFELGVGWESLEGTTKEAKARALVSFLANRFRLTELQNEIVKARPHLPQF
jgi:hypothetical protein